MKINKIIWASLFFLYLGYSLSELYFFGYFLINKPEGYIQPKLDSYMYEGVMLVFLLGFFGLITSMKILNAMFWRLTFIIAVSYMVFWLVVGINENGVNYFSAAEEYWWTLLLSLSVLSAFAAIFVYAFKRKEIWS